MKVVVRIGWLAGRGSRRGRLGVSASALGRPGERPCCSAPLGCAGRRRSRSDHVGLRRAVVRRAMAGLRLHRRPGGRRPGSGRTRGPLRRAANAAGRDAACGRRRRRAERADRPDRGRRRHHQQPRLSRRERARRADVASGAELAHRCGPSAADSGGLADGWPARPPSARTDPGTAEFGHAVVRQVCARRTAAKPGGATPVGSRAVDVNPAGARSIGTQPVEAKTDGVHAVTTYERTSERVPRSATSRQAWRRAHGRQRRGAGQAR